MPTVGGRTSKTMGKAERMKRAAANCRGVKDFKPILSATKFIAQMRMTANAATRSLRANGTGA